jgi:N-acetylglucosamine-6-phosphate deacetylase
METIKNVRLILTDRVVDDGWVSFEKTKIHGIGIGEPPEPQSIDGNGDYLAPGLIDLHVHGANGEDFSTATAEGIVKATKFHLAGGTTALCPTTVTSTYENFQLVLNRCEEAKALAQIRLFGVHLEGPHIATTKAGAHDPKLMRPSTNADIDWLVDRASQISQMTLAPELSNGTELIRECSRAGIVSSAGHTEAGEAEMEAAMGAGLNKVTHLFNAMAAASKKGLFRQPGTLEIALTEPSLVCELISDTIHVVPRLLKLAYQAKGADRIALVSDALPGAGLPVGSRFALGLLRCKVGNGFSFLEDDTALAGSVCRLIDLVRVMVKKMGVPIPEAIRMATLVPARVLDKTATLGSLEIGKQADLILFNDEFEVRDVWVKGQRIAQ